MGVHKFDKIGFGGGDVGCCSVVVAAKKDPSVGCVEKNSVWKQLLSTRSCWTVVLIIVAHDRGGVHGVGSVDNGDMHGVGSVHNGRVYRRCALRVVCCGVGHNHVAVRVVISVAMSLAGTDGVDGVQLVLVGSEELVTGGCHLVRIPYRDAGGNTGSQRTHVGRLAIPVGVGAVGESAGYRNAVGLMGGGRHHHCQNNLLG